jgi:predicted nucleotidyltransferase
MAAVHQVDAAGRERLLAALRGALTAHSEVCFAYLFGSAVGLAGFRDVDVAVWLAAGADRFADIDLAGELAQKLRLPVDVRRINDAPVSFLFHVLRGVPLLVRDEGLLASLTERVAREYHDRAPLVRRATREAFAA